MSNGQADLPTGHEDTLLSRDRGATNPCIEIDDFGLPPFSQQGGLGRVHQLFGGELVTVVEELNRELVA